MALSDSDLNSISKLMRLELAAHFEERVEPRLRVTLYP